MLFSSWYKIVFSWVHRLLSSRPCACSHETGGEYADTFEGLVEGGSFRVALFMVKCTNTNPKRFMMKGRREANELQDLQLQHGHAKFMKQYGYLCILSTKNKILSCICIMNIYFFKFLYTRYLLLDEFFVFLSELYYQYFRTFFS